MKKYWLLLDSYVFLWKDSKKILIYNCLSQKGFTLDRNAIIDPVIEEINDKKNLRVASIDTDFLSSKEGNQLVSLLRENFCGDLFDQAYFPHKPVVVLPELNNNEEIGRSASTISNIEGFGSQVARNLLEVTLQLTGKCDKACRYCKDIGKQIRWCRANTYFFPEEKLVSFLQKIKSLHLYTLNLIGGDLSTYPYWKSIIELLEDAAFHKCVYFNIRQIEKNRSLLEKLQDNHFNIFILAEASSSLLIKKWEQEYHYVFFVTSLHEYEKIQTRIESEGVNAKVLPFFTGDNYSFFKEYIFQSEEDILTTPWKQKEIFAHQVINTNDFGNLYIEANGEVFANLHYPSLGTIETGLEQLVHKEMKNGTSWRQTRDQEPVCQECLYRYLCPSPSNYEKVIGRPDLCLIEKK